MPTRLAGRIVFVSSLRIAIVLLALALVAGCAARAGRPAGVDSGFLRDYAALRPTEKWPSMLLYRNVDANMPRYGKLLVHPVRVWRSANAKLAEIPSDDLQYLADALYRAVETALAPSFEFVDEPGPGVLAIHLALTYVTDPEGPIDFFTTQVPVRDLPKRRGALGAGIRAFIHTAALEAELIDTETNVTRAAVVDRRVGAASPKGRIETWEETASVFALLGTRLRERLEAVKAGTFKPVLKLRGEKTRR